MYEAFISIWDARTNQAFEVYMPSWAKEKWVVVWYFEGEEGNSNGNRIFTGLCVDNGTRRGVSSNSLCYVFPSTTLCFICMCVYMCGCVYMCIYVHVAVYIYTHTHIHIYIHIYIYIYPHTQLALVMSLLPEKGPYLNYLRKLRRRPKSLLSHFLKIK